MSAHTPGPWRFGIRDCEAFIEKPFDYTGPGYNENPSIFGADGTEVVGCDEYMVFSGEADARLIAAAPDLLEALSQASAQMDMAADCIEAGRIDEALLHVRSLSRLRRAAIAKATGESK
jgi:hypothetical protein